MTDKMSSTISRLGVLLALVFFAWIASRLTWRIIEPAPELPAQMQAADKPVTQRQEDYAQTILAAHLFGRPERVVEETPKAPVSRINLRLFGVLATDDKNGLAMIGRNNSPLKLYRVGDRLPGAALLLEIHSDHVLIKANGREEVLLLKSDTKLFKVTPDTAARPRSAGSAQSLSQLRTQVLDQPSQLQNLLTFRPVEKRGGFIGYEVSPKPASAQLFRKLGLQRGDVVTSVNGVALSSPSRSVEALMRLSEAEHMNVVVERNGRQINLQDSFD